MRIHCVSSRRKDSLAVVVFCYMLMCVGCFGLVVSTCQVIGWKDPSEDQTLEQSAGFTASVRHDSRPVQETAEDSFV